MPARAARRHMGKVCVTDPIRKCESYDGHRGFRDAYRGSPDLLIDSIPIRKGKTRPDYDTESAIHSLSFD